MGHPDRNLSAISSLRFLGNPFLFGFHPSDDFLRGHQFSLPNNSLHTGNFIISGTSVCFEEVEGDKSTYITEGILRASHRVLSKAPYNNLGLPYHRHYKSDLVSFPAGEPVELIFDLLPVAYQFRAGNRVRISVTCADADNFETPTLNPLPKIRLLRNSVHASFVEFPIIRGR